MSVKRNRHTGGDNIVGYKIRERREELRMSQEELSVKSGVSRQTISSLENTPGKSVSTRTLEKLASALNTTVGDLFFTPSV